MRVDFTTTATCRPEVLVRTFSSFRDNLLGIELREQRLYLNVDPVPNTADCPEVVRIAKAFFGEVMLNTPPKACFPTAVKWCWYQPRTKYFFHLEDDWEMTRPFEFARLVFELEENTELSCVNLRAYNGMNDDRICLSPGLFRTSHAKLMAGRMIARANPEKQLRPVDEANPFGGKHEGFFGCRLPENIILRDIGRAWMDRVGWKKTKPIYFTSWEPVDHRVMRLSS